MHRQTSLHLSPHGITADQFVCLAILNEEDGITQNELVKRATSDPNTMRAMLMLLEKRELLERHQHPTDGRARLVNLTPKGRQLFQVLLKAVKPVHVELLTVLETENSAALLNGLVHISRTMQNIKTQNK